MKQSDWPAVAEVYKQGIETRMATFETNISDWDTWNREHLQVCRLVAELDHNIVGWIALSPVSKREVYKGVAELTVYVRNGFKGMKIGALLMEHLIKQSEQEGFWTLQSVVFPENEASIRLHQKFGFRKVGYRKKIAKLDGEWRNTILLERRRSEGA